MIKEADVKEILIKINQTMWNGRLSGYDPFCTGAIHLRTMITSSPKHVSFIEFE